jgi:tRNA threonylcarbamoyl adenosine modification protein (Sua5/YciO/YrdC/YwlC family)
MASTKIIEITEKGDLAKQLKLAAECLREGGLVAFPTETVYGIGVNLDNKEAVKRLLDVRKSPQDKIITIHIADKDEIYKYVNKPISARAQRLIKKFWPGPLTLVLPAPEGKTTGLRFPNHPVACEVIRQSGVKVGAPSANISGQPPATDGKQVIKEFEGKVDFIIDGGETKHKTSSTVARVVTNKIEILREGAIPKQLLLDLNYAYIIFVCSGNTCRSPIAEALFKTIVAQRFKVKIEELEKIGFKISSAGTTTESGASASQGAIDIVKEFGGDISSHRSTQLTPEMIEDADWVVNMTKQQKEMVEKWAPEHSHKIILLNPEGKDIEDPLSGSKELYRQCVNEIKRCLIRRVEELIS